MKINKDNYSVYALDLPGFGGSSAPKTPFTISDYADIVSGFMEKMKIKKTILVGHSFGGRIAIKLASAKPELVSKLVLVDSAGFVNMKKQGYQLYAKLVKPLFKPKWMQRIRTWIYKKMGAEDYVSTPYLRETFLNVIKEDVTSDLSNIRIPSLLLWGDKDMDTPVSYGKKMHVKIRNSQLVVLQDAGHFCFLDKPTEFYQALIRFIT
ncbi:MAG: alpha/beta hydrolase [Microgenomates group bacterium GW2011_GWC1_43_11]|nr:MAG: alpha/beta hydrolase [Microgenomates group bacterium GW2011_GWC1_43_11]KKT60536.1 MAG: alpha/beta hydrolase [Candidatus Gottesmanbacteria bacterium GW2011_GWA1_44_24b]